MPFGFVAAAVIGGAATYFGSQKQAQGQEQAAQTQADMFNKIQAQEQPFMQAGYGSTSQLSDMLGPEGYLNQKFNPTMDQLENYPGFKFAQKTGSQAIRNADTPGSGALSGATLKDLMSFNTGLASQYYGDYFNQFQTQQNNIFNRLFQLSTLGQNAASNTGTQGAALGTGIAQAQAGAAASRAAGIAGAGNSAANSIPLYMLYQQNQGAGAGAGGGGGGGTGEGLLGGGG